jgi:hypothetical protein
MGEEAEKVALDRRRLLAKSLPFVLNAAWEVHSVFSPAGLTLRAVSEYERLESNSKLQKEELKTLTEQIGQLDVHSEGTGRISLALTRGELLEVIGNFLVLQFLNEGSRGARFMPISRESSDYDRMLRLPDKRVFAKLLEKGVSQDQVSIEMEEAKKLNPSETWILTYENNHRLDITFDPVFVSEKKILHGRFKILPVTDMFNTITKGHFTASIERAQEGPGTEKIVGPKTRFLFKRTLASG